MLPLQYVQVLHLGSLNQHNWRRYEELYPKSQSSTSALDMIPIPVSTAKHQQPVCKPTCLRNELKPTCRSHEQCPSSAVGEGEITEQYLVWFPHWLSFLSKHWQLCRSQLDHLWMSLYINTQPVLMAKTCLISGLLQDLKWDSRAE